MDGVGEGEGELDEKIQLRIDFYKRRIEIIFWGYFKYFEIYFVESFVR